MVGRGCLTGIRHKQHQRWQVISNKTSLPYGTMHTDFQRRAEKNSRNNAPLSSARTPCRTTTL